ncbi:unnamed protein product [Nezara viridula]|uniref:Neuropeptide n=1 Tax=Nezara viridula TaxID=85310 RepID=A0A9P0E3L9_NEZVI|nr:unnamed protein product [Nezara viridula]
MGFLNMTISLVVMLLLFRCASVLSESETTDTLAPYETTDQSKTTVEAPSNSTVTKPTETTGTVASNETTDQPKTTVEATSNSTVTKPTETTVTVASTSRVQSKTTVRPSSKFIFNRRRKTTTSNPTKSTDVTPTKTNSTTGVPPTTTDAVSSNSTPRRVVPENSYCVANPGRCEHAVMYSKCYRCIISENCSIQCQKRFSCSKCELPIIGKSRESYPTNISERNNGPNTERPNNRGRLTRIAIIRRNRNIWNRSIQRTIPILSSYNSPNRGEKLKRASLISINIKNCDEDIYITRGCYNDRFGNCLRNYMNGMCEYNVTYS